MQEETKDDNLETDIDNDEGNAKIEHKDNHDDTTSIEHETSEDRHVTVNEINTIQIVSAGQLGLDP